MKILQCTGMYRFLGVEIFLFLCQINVEFWLHWFLLRRKKTLWIDNGSFHLSNSKVASWTGTFQFIVFFLISENLFSECVVLVYFFFQSITLKIKQIDAVKSSFGEWVYY